MKRKSILVIVIVLLAGCAPFEKPLDAGPAGLQYVQGTVQAAAGSDVTILLKTLDFGTPAQTPAAEIARQIVQKGLFIEGLRVSFDGNSGAVTTAANNLVTVRLDKPRGFAAGQSVRLEVPRKRIAVVDFTLIRGGFKEAGAVLMEQLATALIESKQFIVVERSKLNTIMEEIKLLQSGITEEIPERLRPKLMFADLILTGTLAELGDKYDINLRLLNVRTGQAIAAINSLGPLYSPGEARDSSAWNEDFETFITDRSWIVGPWGTQGICFISVDRKTGANGSGSSLKMDFNFKGVSEYFCHFQNNKKRDLSLYKGIEFYARATQPMFGLVNIDISDRDDPNRRDRWQARFEIGAEWNIVRITFDEFYVLQKKWIERSGFLPGKQVKDMARVEAIFIAATDRYLSKKGEAGALWIDKVRFYK